MGGREPLSKLKEVKIVGGTLLLLLVLIALIALAEKGPPAIPVFKGASPFNTGPIGTFNLIEALRNRYPQTSAITSHNELDTLFRGAENCLLISISPEVEHTVEEAKLIRDKLRLCRSPAVLIADEGRTSNNILKVLNSSIRVPGRILYDRSTGLPYVYATIVLPTGNITGYRVLLDIASELEILSSMPQVVGVTDDGAAVAALEEVEGVRVAVVGDGSIFLNQVLAAGVLQYRELVLGLVDHLCDGRRDCRIAVDGTKYTALGTDLGEIGVHPYTLYIDPVSLILRSVVRVLHPSSWLLPALSAVNSFFENVKRLSFAAPLLLLATALLVYRYAKKGVELAKDRRVEEQKELEVYVTGALRESIARGRVSLDKGDFLNLFDMVNSVVRSVYGVGLCDSDAVKVLPQDKKVAKYVRDMCRLYDKASGRRRLPIVFSWGRRTKKMISRSEEFLNTIGQSLASEKGVEYVLLR